MLFFKLFVICIIRPFQICCMKYFTKSFLYYQQGSKSLKAGIPAGLGQSFSPTLFIITCLNFSILDILTGRYDDDFESDDNSDQLRSSASENSEEEMDVRKARKQTVCTSPYSIFKAYKSWETLLSSCSFILGHVH